MSANTTLHVNIPKQATKNLKLQSFGEDKRKLVISTNWLPLFGFEEGAYTKEELIGKNKGIRIILAQKDEKNIKKVYLREYKSRKNNPLETLLDIRRQTLINDAFPFDALKVHIVFKYGEILITPITNKKQKALDKFKKSKNKFSTFLACSSGVDGVSLVKNGFSIETLLEYRPNEKRDKNDLSETGALNAISNFEVNTLINEDITNIDLQKLCSLTKRSEHTFAHICLQCDDFTNVKANSLKDGSLLNGDTTIDMVYDALRIIDTLMFPTILFENVPNFFTGDAGKILFARLKRFGYELHYNKYDARDYGGNTSRVRGFLFATLLGAEFKKPSKIEKNNTPLWDRFIEPKILKNELRDVSSTKSLKDGITTGRARLITRDSTCSGTILKSQNRQAKDSVYIYDGKRECYYFPSNELLAELMDIKMNFDSTSKTIESEIIGQSIDVPTHKSILNSVKDHIYTSAMQMTGKLL